MTDPPHSPFSIQLGDYGMIIVAWLHAPLFTDLGALAHAPPESRPARQARVAGFAAGGTFDLSPVRFHRGVARAVHVFIAVATADGIPLPASHPVAFWDFSFQTPFLT